MHHTETIVDEIVNATCDGKNQRTRYLMRESLRSLVRLAKTEQLMEIRKIGTKLTRQSGKKAIHASHITP